MKTRKARGDEDEEGIYLTPEEEAELDAAIEDADRNPGISGEEMLRRLRALREQDERQQRR